MTIRKPRSILDELDSLAINKDKEQVFESRANHVIQAAINLINSIKESYSDEIAFDLERRLLNSIKGQDPEKFSRGMRRIRSESK